MSNFADELSNALKYAVGSDAPNKVKASKLVDQLIQRHTTFVPTASSPHPHQHLQESEREFYNDRIKEVDPAYPTKSAVLYPDDAHDLGAVLAGTKPAALVDADFINHHFVGQEFLKRAKATGHSVVPIKSEGASSFAIGKPASVQKIRESFTADKPHLLNEGLGLPASKNTTTNIAELYRRQ